MTKKLPQKFDKSAVSILSQRPLFQGFFAMEEVRFTHRQFNGEQSNVVNREVFERGDAVVVLPYDPVTDQVILIEQLRVPALRTSETPWLLELVAGIIEPGETIEDVARRELLEEAGLETCKLMYLTSFLTSPGACTERLYLYLAEVDAPKESVSDGFGLDGENEDIRRHVVSRAQALSWVKEGIIDNGSAMVGLQWLQLFIVDNQNYSAASESSQLAPGQLK